ncbi:MULTISPECIES: MFS transporter [unclassified Knoellia]|uniref:MFS transporter n=1 Tax=Knoellia altitudinis TaxID=3404795 RepID=UPI003622D7E5
MKQLLHEYHRVLTIGQARLVLGATVGSLIGDVMAMVALLLHLHDRGHGPYAVMTLLICFALPLVLTMGLAGSVADSHPPRLVLLVALSAQAVGALGLVMAPSLVWTCIGVLVMQTGFAFAMPVWNAVMPLVVGDELSGTYVSLAQGLRAVASPLGAALAGVVVQQWGTRAALGVNAATFLAVIAAALALRVNRSTVESRHSLLPRDGLRVLRADPVMSALVLGVIPIILTLEAVNAVEVFLVRGELGASPAQFGLAEAAGGVGAVVGAFAAAALRTRDDRVRAILIGLAVVPLLQIGQGLAPEVWVYAVAAFAVGLALGVVNAAIFALLLREIAEGDRGKVLALVSGLSRTATIGALAIGGVLGTQVGARTAYVVCGVVGLLIAATAALRVRAGVHRSVDDVSTRRSVRQRT